MKKKVKFEYEVTIDTEQVVELYPNYRRCFGNVYDFIEMLRHAMIDGATGGIEDTMEKFGYEVQIK